MPILPDTVEAWQRCYAKIVNKDFGSAKFESGSKFKFESAILLRVLHSRGRMPPEPSIRMRWIDNQIFPAARQSEAEAAVNSRYYEPLLRITKRPSKNWTSEDFMNSGIFGSFLSLLALIEQNNNINEEEGSAVKYITTPPIAARTRLQQVRRDPYITPIKKSTGQFDFASTLTSDMDLETPSTTESIEPPLSHEGSVAEYERARIKVQDEQTVNQCLINLLLPISWPLGISGNIDPQRKAYIFVLQGSKAYEARVDGIITHPKNKNDILGFLEVKRNHRTDEVRIQEVAQMVAFMNSKNNTSTSQRSWLISMCANEIFITIANCNQSWIEFLGAGEGLKEDMPELKSENFLHMEEYGPYTLNNYHDLVAVLKHLYILLHPIS